MGACVIFMTGAPLAENTTVVTAASIAASLALPSGMNRIACHTSRDLDAQFVVNAATLKPKIDVHFLNVFDNNLPKDRRSS